MTGDLTSDWMTSTSWIIRSIATSTSVMRPEAADILCAVSERILEVSERILPICSTAGLNLSIWPTKSTTLFFLAALIKRRHPSSEVASGFSIMQ